MAAKPVAMPRRRRSAPGLRPRRDQFSPENEQKSRSAPLARRELDTTPAPGRGLRATFRRVVRSTRPATSSGPPARAVAWPADVRGPFRPVRRYFHPPSGPGPAQPGGRRRSPAGNPHGPAPGRRQLAGGAGRHRAPADGAGGRRTGPQPDPGPASRQGGPRRAGEGPGRDGAQDHVRFPASDGRAPRRPARRRQNDGRRQAGPVVQAAGTQPAARGDRPSAPSRRRAVAGPGQPDKRPRVLRTLGPGDSGQKRPGRSAPNRAGRSDRRHGRPPAHRRRNDGTGPPDLGDRSNLITRSWLSTP